MNKYKVLLASSFNTMLKYTLYKNKYYSIAYTNKVVDKIYQAITVIKTFPYATPSVKFKYKVGEYRKYIVSNRFLIIFKIESDNIYLLYFIDGRKSLNNYFKINVD